MKVRFAGKPFFLVLITSLLGCAGNDEPAGERVRAAEPRFLVSAEALLGHLDDPSVLVVHVGADSLEYASGHIPAARFLDTRRILEEREGIPNLLPPVETLRDVFRDAGISNDSRVVLYDEGGWLPATRAFFTLDYLGHDDIAVLDGGLPAWYAAGGDISRAPPEPRRGDFSPRVRPEVVVDADWVHSRLGDPDVALIDARPPAQYRGDEAGGVLRPGRIPGAANVFWRDALRSENDPRLRNPDELRSRLAEAGARPDGEVVTYCRTGVQSSHSYFVARYLGYEPRMYDGSFIDWSARPDLPIEPDQD